jgi:hypothetical protein
MSTYLFCFALAEPLEEQSLNGSDEGTPVELLKCGEVVAPFCRVPTGDWTGSVGDANLADLTWIGPRVLRHQQVIGRVKCCSPVLPVRFGTLFSTPEKLTPIIETHHERIVDFLRYVEDKEEWSVQGLIDRQKVEDHLFANHPGQAHLPKSPGARYLYEKRLRQDVTGSVQKWLDASALDIGRELQELSVDSKILRTRRSEDREGEGDMVFNWALLIASGSCEEFLDLIEVVGLRHEEAGLKLKVTGPWAPYSFGIELDLVTEARP